MSRGGSGGRPLGLTVVVHTPGPLADVPPPHATYGCEETTDGNTCPNCHEVAYTRCGRPATHVVWHSKDRRAYYMCRACADHNVRNRGGVLVKEVL